MWKTCKTTSCLFYNLDFIILITSRENDPQRTLKYLNVLAVHIKYKRSVFIRRKRTQKQYCSIVVHIGNELITFLHFLFSFTKSLFVNFQYWECSYSIGLALLEIEKVTAWVIIEIQKKCCHEPLRSYKHYAGIFSARS